MTIQMNNWCDTCQEVCHDHTSICTVCGTALGAAPADSSAPNNNNNNSSNASSSNATAPSIRALPVGLMEDLRDANRDLQEILGSLRGQVQDLDALTRGILLQQHGQERGQAGGQWQTVPAELLNPQNSSSHRPTSKQTLNEMPRIVLDEKSTLFRQATLEMPSLMTTAESRPATIKCSCVMGEFGPTQDFNFVASPLIVCSPLTGKGGALSSTTTQLISQLAAQKPTSSNDTTATTAATTTTTTTGDHNKVIAFLQRGDDVTFVQKALLAQKAGAAAVLIGNNTSTSWPYVMKDSNGEAEKLGLTIPVAMIKEDDAQQVLQLYREYHHQLQLQQDSARLSSTSTTQRPCYFSCSLDISQASSRDCVVCCERLAVGDKVLRLPGCGHIFHVDCALAWLTSHNTCPYCRRELPTDDPEYEKERRRQQRTHAGSTGSGSSAATAAAFYG